MDKAPAQKYAKSNMLFEAQMGLVDRGADISWLSQYPEESEVLYPPLTAYEVIGEPRTEHGAGRSTPLFTYSASARTLSQNVNVYPNTPPG